MAVQAEILRELTAERLQFISAALARKAANEYSEGNSTTAEVSLQLGAEIVGVSQRYQRELTEIATRLRGLGLENLEGSEISPPIIPAKENLPDRVRTFRSTESPQPTTPENPYGKLWRGTGKKPVKIYATGNTLFLLNEEGAFLHNSKDKVIDAVGSGRHRVFAVIRIDLRDKMLKIGEEECLTIFPGLDKCLEIARKEVPNKPFADCIQYLLYDRFNSVEKGRVEPNTKPVKKYGHRREVLVREFFSLNEEQTGLRHQDFNQVVESAYADLLKGTHSQRKRQNSLNLANGYESRKLIRGSFEKQGEEWVVVKYPDVKTFLVWAREQPQFAGQWSFLDLVDYGLRLKKVEEIITPVQPVVEPPVSAPSPNGAEVKQAEHTIYSAPPEPKTEPKREQPSVTIDNSTYFHLLSILRQVEPEEEEVFNLHFTGGDRSLMAVYHSRFRSVLSLKDLSQEGVNILIRAVRLLQNGATIVNEVDVRGVESSKILDQVAKSNADFVRFIENKRRTFRPKVQVEKVNGRETPQTLKLNPGERFWLVKSACELPPDDYRFSGIPDSNLPTNTWRLRVGEEVLRLLLAPELLEQKDKDIESLKEKMLRVFHEGNKSEFFHANSVYKTRDVLELLFSINNERSFVAILDRLITAASRASTDKVVVDPNWANQARHLSPLLARRA